MLESIFIVASICLTPTSGTGCDAATQSYVKQNKLDSMAQKYGDRFKLKHPSIYLTGVIIAGFAERKYEASLYGPIGLNVNVSNPNDEKCIIYYKLGF